MSLANTIQLLTTRVAQEFNSVRSDIANNTSVVNSALALKSDITYVDTALGLKADLVYVDSALGLKANTSSVDSALALKADSSVVDSALALKANSADVYTASEVDNIASGLNSSINLKANSADVYLKTEVYTKGETDSAITSGIASVVDAAPEALNTLKELATALGEDANFAGSISTAIGLKSDITYVDSALGFKADTSAVDSALALKADQDTTYTKTEVDSLLSPITGELSDLGSIDLVGLFESTLV